MHSSSNFKNYNFSHKNENKMQAEDPQASLVAYIIYIYLHDMSPVIL